jgi:hypothetical protein
MIKFVQTKFMVTVCDSIAASNRIGNRDSLYKRIENEKINPFENSYEKVSRTTFVALRGKLCRVSPN